MEESIHDAQSKTCATKLPTDWRILLSESRENGIDIFFGDAHSRIDNLNFQPNEILPSLLDLFAPNSQNDFTLFREFEGIGEAESWS